MKNGIKSKLSLAKLIFSMTIFGTVGIVVRNLSLPSGFVAMSRGYIGAVVLLLFMLLTKKLPSASAIKKNIVPLLLSGAFIGINWILLFESYSYTSVATSTLAYYMAPVFVIIASPVVIAERVKPEKWGAVIAAFIGMVLVSEPWSAANGEGAGIFGIFLALGAALFYASVTLTNKKMKDISSLDITFVQLLVASLVITPYALFAEPIRADMFNLESVLLLLTLGLLHTGLSYLFYFGSIKELPAVTVAIFGYIDPIVALILSAAVLSEKMTVFGIIGAALILSATMFSELYPFLKMKAGKNAEEGSTDEKDESEATAE